MCVLLLQSLEDRGCRLGLVERERGRRLRAATGLSRAIRPAASSVKSCMGTESRPNLISSCLPAALTVSRAPSVIGFASRPHVLFTRLGPAALAGIGPPAFTIREEAQMPLLSLRAAADCYATTFYIHISLVPQ